MFDYPTTQAIAGFIARQLAAAVGPAATAAATTTLAVDAKAVQEEVAALVAAQLGATVPATQPLMEAGLDSLGELMMRAAACSSSCSLPFPYGLDYKSSCGPRRRGGAAECAGLAI